MQSHRGAVISNKEEKKKIESEVSRGPAELSGDAIWTNSPSSLSIKEDAFS